MGPKCLNRRLHGSMKTTKKELRPSCPDSCFLFFQVETPVTLFSGYLWSILVVRLAHSADLRSRLCHVHVSSTPSVVYSTGCSRLVTHPGTNPARRCLTSVIWREPICHRRLAVDFLDERIDHHNKWQFSLAMIFALRRAPLFSKLKKARKSKVGFAEVDR